MATLLDFRSDTVTQPTPEMRRAMADAIVGDDILGDDPTVDELEEYAARLLGKQAALFVISGTMANQVAIHTLTERGDEVLAGEETHILNLEVGGLAALSGVQIRPLRSKGGRFSPDDVRKAIRPSGVQSTVSRVLCLENTYNLNQGIPLPPDYISSMADLAHDHGMKVYLDGARLCNAAVSLNVSEAAICEKVDAVELCLSKGLAAPVGAVIAGSDSFIDKARWVRQRFGGGMRQAGHMAAAGLVAMRTMRSRLAEDHENARVLASALAKLHPGLVDMNQTLSNVVKLDFAAVGKTAQFVVERLEERGIKVKPISETECRMITHWGIEREHVDRAIHAISEVVALR